MDQEATRKIINTYIEDIKAIYIDWCSRQGINGREYIKSLVGRFIDKALEEFTKLNSLCQNEGIDKPQAYVDSVKSVVLYLQSQTGVPA